MSEMEEKCRARVAAVEEQYRSRIAEAEAARRASDQQREHIRMQFKKISVVLEAREESVNSLQKRAEEAEAALAECQGTLDAEKKRVEAAESTLTSARGEICSLEGQLARVRRQSNDHFKRALRLERSLNEATVTAVENYKASQAYRDDVAEASIDAFMKGFEDFRSQVVRAFPGLDFSHLAPVFGEVNEDVSSSEEAFEGDAEASHGAATEGTSDRPLPVREDVAKAGPSAGTSQAAEVPPEDTRAEAGPAEMGEATDVPPEDPRA